MVTRADAVEFLDIEGAGARGLDVPDVYYSPDYARSARHIDGGKWEVAVAGGGDLLFPYVKRQVPGHPDLYDLVSPYGYSTVLGPGAAARRAFVHAFREASRERGLVAEFLRGHPFDLADPEADGLMVDSYRSHATYAVDLRAAGLDDYWETCEGRHRTAVRKAERRGVEVVQRPPASLEDQDSGFRRIYRETMERVGSAGRLKVGDEYFRQLNAGLGDGVLLLEACHDGEPVAASIFLRWGERLHYHLSGSVPEGMRSGATNLILDRAVRELLPPGGRLHLGGGVTPGDGLDRFKRSVGNARTHVHLCRTVVDKGRYDALVQEAGVASETDYFPAYRA